MTIKGKRSRSWREELQELIDQSPDAPLRIKKFAQRKGYDGAYLLKSSDIFGKTYQPYTISDTRPMGRLPSVIMDTPDFCELVQQEDVLDTLEKHEYLWRAFVHPVPAEIEEYVLRHNCLSAIFECTRGEISFYRVFERGPHRPDFDSDGEEKPRGSFLLAMRNGFVTRVLHDSPAPYDVPAYINGLVFDLGCAADHSQDDASLHPGGAAIWEKNREYSRFRTEEFIKRIHSVPKTPAAVTEFAKENGYAGAFLLGRYCGCRLYQPYTDPDRPPVTGPLNLIFFQNRRIRLAELETTLDIMDMMAADKDFRFIHAVPKAVLNKLDNHLTAVYDGCWNGFQLYQPYDYDWRVIRYTGFPCLFLYRDGKAHELISPATLDIWRSVDRIQGKRHRPDSGPWHDELQHRLEKTTRATPDDVLSLARKLGYEGAYHLADWRTLPPGPAEPERPFPHLGKPCDFEIYQPYVDDDPFLRFGQPVMLLKPLGNTPGQRSRVVKASLAETLEIMERLLSRQEKDGTEDLSIHFAPADVLALARKHGQITAVFDSYCHNGDEDYFDFYRTYPRNSSNRAGSPNALFKHHGDADHPGNLEWIRGIPSGLHPGLWF